MQVQKTASADITSAFGGGYVNVRTKNKFNEDYAKLKVGLELHSTFGNEVISSQGGDADWTGTDDGYRAFSGAFQSSITPKVGAAEPELTQTRTEMQNIISQRSYNHKTTDVPFGKSVGVEFAKKIDLDDEQTLYFLGGYGYKTKHKNIEYTDYDYVIASDGTQQDDPLNTPTTQRYVTNIQHGGLFNLGYTFRGLELQLLKLYVLNTLDQTRFAEGTFGTNRSDEQRTYLEWQERELDANQLTGSIDYKVYLDNKFSFGYEYATASEYVPNDIYYNYKKSIIPGSDYEFMRNQSQMTFLNRSTDDKLTNFYLNNKTIIPMLSDEDFVEIGYVNEDKTRESRVSKFEMKSRLTDQTITTTPIDNIVNYSDPESFLRFNLLSPPKESYDASLKRTAYYLKTGLKPIENSDLVLGLR
ncbi:MAG: hypothetical protein IE909_17125, partial [Campylobacterales bacterium]|nr:hypothetical protein [Campylobacterales bacterium]